MNEREVARMDLNVDPGHARVVYILYLLALFLGITIIIGVVMAYVNKDDAPAWLQTHYRYQIRTFWIGVLFNTIAAMTMFLVVGWFILLFTLIWLIIRCVKGLKVLSSGAAIANPGSWLFG